VRCDAHTVCNHGRQLVHAQDGCKVTGPVRWSACRQRRPLTAPRSPAGAARSMRALQRMLLARSTKRIKLGGGGVEVVRRRGYQWRRNWDGDEGAQSLFRCRRLGCSPAGAFRRPGTAAGSRRQCVLNGGGRGAVLS
jgi:hypothetical protein